MYFDDSGLVAIIKDENVKCKTLVFQTSDVVLVQTALLKLGFKQEDYTLKKTPDKFNWETFRK